MTIILLYQILYMFLYVRKKKFHLTTHLTGPKPMFLQLASEKITPISITMDNTYYIESIMNMAFNTTLSFNVCIRIYMVQTYSFTIIC